MVGISWTLADTIVVQRLGSVDEGEEVEGSFSVR